ncbi:MAG: GAF domain-containing protein [Chloroflexi bacterium]|nr:GAF domain-containing protein [Chloroflexota bacterium]OJV92007.1 MAG: hypothetical protein BGO39_12955 [Chloroflexi bacterium 54-19]
MSAGNLENQVDLTNCDREPIHIPGSIQPHGVLLALLEPDFTIVQSSVNTLEHFKIAREDLLDRNLDTLLADEYIEVFRTNLADYDLEKNPLYLFTTPVLGQTAIYDWIAHKIDGLLILEAELSRKPALDPYFQLKAVLNAFANAGSLPEYFEAIARQVQVLTGFDRVMVYKFDEDGHGTVISEAKKDELSPFLGLHYPASDIPRQARALYLLNWLRLIPDVSYSPVIIQPTDNMLTGRPLDQSFSTLRSVSPIHLQYLKNMGVGASMSISIVKDNDLWGLVACHHETPHYLPYSVRSACELLAQAISLQLADKIEREGHAYRTRLQTVLNKLVEFMVSQSEYYQGLFNFKPNLADFIEAGGVAFFARGKETGSTTLLTLGETPDQNEIEALVAWLEQTNRFQQDVYYSSRLPEIYESALAFKDKGSGLLTMNISKLQRQYILWFRPEVVQTVNWAGNPNKPVEWKAGEAILSPRHSFEEWREQLSNHSERWKTEEIEAAQELRRAMLSVVLRRMDELNRLSVVLEEQKDQAPAALEETGLKEPLQEIQTYLSFLLEEYGARLNQLEPDDKSASFINLDKVTRRMKSLLDSLLNSSRGEQQF